MRYKYLLLIILFTITLTGCGAQTVSTLTKRTIEEYFFEDKTNTLPRIVEVPTEEITNQINLPPGVPSWRIVVEGNCTCFALTTNSKGETLPQRQVECTNWTPETVQKFSVYGEPASCRLYFHIPQFSRDTVVE